ncbi:MAG: anacyclamide/piricyclamide family prenylated cyclic peptide [Oscillatoria princeps RMCB-10]|jgi:prenylated cyclic peptide (anacyclamide/piricyclamide family)|nr:anacyclamide/piricyclamide family prenylated cyclic peptide [Oscillatoria princeps RMCB-10]
MKNKTVMPKQAAPVERLSPATAGAAGASAGGEKEGVGPLIFFLPQPGGGTSPFAGDDAE